MLQKTSHGGIDAVCLSCLRWRVTEAQPARSLREEAMQLFNFGQSFYLWSLLTLGSPARPAPFIAQVTVCLSREDKAGLHLTLLRRLHISRLQWIIVDQS